MALEGGEFIFIVERDKHRLYCATGDGRRAPMHLAKSRRSLFLYGALGGLLPTLSTLATTFVTVPETPLPAIGMLYGLVLMGVVGGGAAMTNSTLEIRQAVITGVAAPAILMSIVSGATDSRRKSAQLFAPFTAMAELFIQTARAQEPPGFSKAGSTLVINPTVKGAALSGADIPITAAVKNADGLSRTVQVGTIRSTENPIAFTLPAGTYEAFVAGQGIAITRPVTEANVIVTTRPTISGDFWWALGAPRKFEVQGVQLTSPQK